MLRAVDISSWQAGISPAALECDIVIIKATGGTSYVNPYWKEWADEVLRSGKLLGLYHFAYESGCHGTAAQEAAAFFAEVRPYKGRFVPILDWENDALALPASWAREWLENVSSALGSTPFFYGYASNVNSTDYSALAGYPLWMASYLNRYDGAGWVEDPANTWGTGDWGSMSMYQYTSTGRISGWDGNLDLSVFYGSESDWKRMQGGSMGLGNVAAAIHKDMCDDAANGYSWSPRWGEDGLGVKTLTIDGQSYSYDRGSYECGTSCTTAWKAALAHTKYAHMLDGYSTTRNMREVYVASGLFEWKPMSFLAEPGDLYLSEQNHVAMCQSQVPDMLSEFCINENGGVYGGLVGDQTGTESYVHGYYDYPGGWDGILHYNGKADGEMAKSGWIEKNGKWWYRHSDGSWTSNGWEKINDKWYFFDKDGWMKTGWIDWKGDRYYCQPKTSKTGNDYGYMLADTAKKIGGKVYSFDETGKMRRRCFRKSAKGNWYCYGKDGARIMSASQLAINAQNGIITIK